MGVKIVQNREGVIRFLPQTNLILLFASRTTVQNFVKINKNCGCRSAYRHTDRQRQVILLSVPCYAIAMGLLKIKLNILLPGYRWVVKII